MFTNDDVKTLADVLVSLGLRDRIRFPTPDFDPTKYEVIVTKSSCVSASDGDKDLGRLFVHVGGGMRLMGWSGAGGSRSSGYRFPLQTGWAVVVVSDGPRSMRIELVGTA